MKTVLVIILLTMVGVVLATVSQTTTNEDISILSDQTDEYIGRPSLEEIKKTYDLDGENKWNGVTIRILKIADVSFLPVQQVSIKSEVFWFSNEFERKKSIDRFESQLKDLIGEVNQGQGEKAHSSILRPLMLELQRLSKSKAQRRILIIYSDLMENTIEQSFYGKGKITSSEVTSNLIENLFPKDYQLPDLKGIQVYIIFQPQNAEMDKEFKTVSGFYKSLLESKGAEVTIGANLQM